MLFRSIGRIEARIAPQRPIERDEVARLGELRRDERAPRGEQRPLGVEAAYGHALMALAHHQLAQRPQPAKTDDVEPMDHNTLTLIWWQRATLLLPVQALVQRFAELQTLAEKFAPETVASQSAPADDSDSAQGRA